MRESVKIQKKTYSDLSGKTIIVTGVAGFIGGALAIKMLNDYNDINLVGVDNLNAYYIQSLKQYRLEQIQKQAGQCKKKNKWTFQEIDIANNSQVYTLINDFKPSIVVNLAAQAGIRYSVDYPETYIHSNLNGFFSILECCRNDDCLEHFVYASSSSVYGGRTEVPFKETDDVSYPVSLYAATKKSNELMAYSYSKLYDIPSTGLRFFTVYGPAGRPDMAYFSFTEKLRRGEKIDIFNYGNCERDFTYIDDIVDGIIKVMQCPPKKRIGEDGLPIAPYEIYNIGNSHPENLMTFVRTLAEELVRAEVLDKDFDIEEHINLVPMQPGDVPITYADTSKLEKEFGYKPSTDLRTGLRRFAEWYKDYYG